MKHINLRRFFLPLALLALIAAVTAGQPAAAAIIDDPNADQGGRPFNTTLTGAAEAPRPGDPDGSGTAFLTLNQGQAEICYELTVTGIETAGAAHIHRAVAGVAGPVVVPLSAPTSGSSSGCARVNPDLIKEIRQNPEGFYVNVHNAVYPAGALRGQLGK